MKFQDNIFQYLNGESFSNSLKIDFKTNEQFITKRIDFLENLTKEKKIIHLGCCDHINLIEDKIRKNMWLHKRLCNVTNRCLGIDIDSDAIKYIKDLGYSDVISKDILTDNVEEIQENNWDFLIMGELLEHINNPQEFLSIIHKKYTTKILKLVITVPNAFAFSNHLNTLKNIEIINSDHKYWFTPYTLAKIATNAGFQVENFYFMHEISKKIGLRAKVLVYPYIKRKINYNRLMVHPGLRSTLMMILNF